MAGIKWAKFGGLRPLASKLRLGATEADVATNVDLHRGFLKPRAKQQAWNADLHPSLLLSPSDVPASLFRFRDRFNADEYWMYWTGDVDVAMGPVENAEQRHYYTGDGVPKMFTKDSITDTTPPYPQAADAKYPKTWFYLGVPAPGTAPSVDGTSYVPPDTAKTGVITGLEVPNLVIRFNPARPSRGIDIIKSGRNGVSVDVSGETHMDSDAGAMNFEALKRGLRVKVTEIVGANQVRVSGTVGTHFLEDIQRGTGGYDDPVPENIMDTRWKWDPDEITPNNSEEQFLYRRINGKGNDICWTYHVPEGAVLNITAHALRVGDVVRIISATSPMIWASPTRLLAGPPLTLSTGPGRERALTDPGEAVIEFTGELTFFVERDGREFDPTIDDVVVEAREPTTRAYVYTYVTALGEEGPPSPPTDPFTLALGDSVTIEGFVAPPTERRNITTYRLYRTNTGTQETAFQFVADIAIASTEYADALADDELGEVLQSETYEPPPAEMLGVVAMPNGFLAGFFDNVLCFSEPGFPHAWPVDYRMPLETKVIAIKVIGGALIVATRGTPYVVAGTHPRQMAARRELEPSPCVDKRSMVDCGDVAVYVSTDGLIAAAPDGFRNLTLQHYTREQWIDRVAGPTNATSRSLRAWYKDGEYVLFTTFVANGATVGDDRVFDFRDSDQLRITEPGIDTPRAAFTDPTDGELYYVPSVADALNVSYEDALPANTLPILRWRYLYPLLVPDSYDPDEDGNYAFYRSGILMLPRPMSISVAQVICRRVRSPVGTVVSYGKLELSLGGFRYDAANTVSINEETEHGTELCFVELIRGDSAAGSFAGEQGARPFRIDQNVLVDALSIDVTMRGYVEVEAVLVGESYDDLVELMPI